MRTALEFSSNAGLIAKTSPSKDSPLLLTFHKRSNSHKRFQKLKFKPKSSNKKTSQKKHLKIIVYQPD